MTEQRSIQTDIYPYAFIMQSDRANLHGEIEGDSTQTLRNHEKYLGL